MIFPEELDNRPFRLFVQRTGHLVKRRMALSRTEQQLAELMRLFPDFHFLDGKREIDVNQHYEDADDNPFLVLSALWEIKKQVQTDTPKGICNIVQGAFDTIDLNYRQFIILASTYLGLYWLAKETGRTLTDKDYLYEIQSGIQLAEDFDWEEAEGPEHADNYADASFISSEMMDELLEEFVQDMHDEEGDMPITTNSKLSAMLNKLPIEWIDAASEFWHMPEQRLKRDRIKAIADFLLDDKSVRAIRSRLSGEELAALQFVLDKNGWVKYNAFTKEFGSEEKDGYWWTDEPPVSVLGQLRMKGLLVVGKAPVDSRHHKIVMIPKDLRETVRLVVQ